MNETKAARYQRLRRRAHAVDVACGGALLAGLALTPASRALAGWARLAGQGLPAPLGAVVAFGSFLGALVLLWEVVSLPAVLYLWRRVDRRFVSADRRIGDVLAAQAQATVVALAAAVAAAGIILAAARFAGSAWWIAAGLTLAAGLVAAVRLMPSVLPRLAGTRPVVRPSLMAGLRELARRTGVPLSDIVEWRVGEGGGTTALVAGVGGSRRVFLSSEMLRGWDDDEIAVVVAHELAHHVYHDLWRTAIVDGAFLSIGLWAADRVMGGLPASLATNGAAHLASLPFIGLVVGGVWLLSAPVRHAQSRAQERRADRFALQATGGVEAFGAALRRLSARHLTEDHPSALTRWLFHRHPTVAERLAAAETFRRSRPA